jgi:predicted Zn finger-like uncharacterized protein
MNVSCPSCNTTYRVDPAKVPETGIRARCAVCSAVFLVRGEGAAAPAPAAPAAVSAPPAARAPSPPAPPAPPPASRAPAVPARGQMPPAMPPGAGVRPPAFRPATPPRPAGSPAAPAGSPPPPPRPPVQAAPKPAPAPPLRPPAAPAPSPPAATAAAPRPARPVNPFLTQDPAAKARRLARALISDMVVYHPAKRQEGLRDGTLKQLFEEEIKKSWEEYADQVGKDVADSTPYFRDALNEILADGKQLF